VVRRRQHRPQVIDERTRPIEDDVADDHPARLTQTPVRRHGKVIERVPYAAQRTFF
jgi:hypothetical protein